MARAGNHIDSINGAAAGEAIADAILDGAPAAEPIYRDTLDHLTDELRRLDLLIALRVAAFRRMIEARRAVATQQLYISHEEVDTLLLPPAAMEPSAEEDAIRAELAVLEHAIERRIAASLAAGSFLGLPGLGQLFGLSPFELAIVLVCLAPELDRKYDRLYAYLQDDITRKKPSVDLVLDLLCESDADRWRARALLSEHAPLMRGGILSASDDPASPSGSSGLARFLALDSRIIDFILGRGQIHARLIGCAEVLNPSPSHSDAPVDPEVAASLRSLLDGQFGPDARSERRRVAVHLRGARGSGSLELALWLCRELNAPLVRVDVPMLLAKEGYEELARLALREGPLTQAAIYLEDVDSLLGEEESARIAFKRLAAAVADYGWLLFMAGEKEWPAHARFDGMLFHAAALPPAGFAIRREAWRRALGGRAGEIGEDGLARLASRFNLTPGQIRDAADRASSASLARVESTALTVEELFAACREQASIKLRELAQRQRSRYGWDDLVLPDDKVKQLREICAHVKHRDRVFGEWGFDRKLSHGKGLSALFTGPPGTGKTMAASVIARELGLDLYKVDLSGVVSKYIGETEKNLARIFSEAETSNAILFFDEADALFGKRTEVSDAHDRYANIETSYLLQRMEEYEGVVILATNLRDNMDEAFTRRLRFVVEFPFPDESSRMRIWRTHFPADTPLHDEVDFDFLASRLKIAGGNIKNIVLSAAFAAAEDGDMVTMEHVLYGARREFEKIGKLWTNDHRTK